MLDTTYARSAVDTESLIRAHELNPTLWRQLQESYRVGELLMPCCDGAAIPKTSPLGLQFFSHASGQCSTSPEGQWHQQGKEVVAAAAIAMGMRATIEHRHDSGARADVWIEGQGAVLAVELQHSYQHLRSFLARQARYSQTGARCLWLLPQARFHALNKATTRRRYTNEFARSWPEGQGPCLRELPAAMLDLSSAPIVRGPHLCAALPDVLSAALGSRLQWQEGRWTIT